MPSLPSQDKLAGGPRRLTGCCPGSQQQDTRAWVAIDAHLGLEPLLRLPQDPRDSPLSPAVHGLTHSLSDPRGHAGRKYSSRPPHGHMCPVFKGLFLGAGGPDPALTHMLCPTAPATRALPWVWDMQLLPVRQVSSMARPLLVSTGPR